MITPKEEIDLEFFIAEKAIEPYNPTKNLSPLDYKLGTRINSKKQTCACGKEIQEYYQVEKIVKPRSKATMKRQAKKKIKPQTTKAWVNHGYPQLYCHCNCGLTWGTH